ncbi:MAG: hypothetical protein K9J48_05335 [Desulfohalobiaceae bacterium]|nr:hypothetical protein [Desulfohalobiaceae bacterium]
MSLFRRQKKPDWQDRFHLAEDFRELERDPAQYPVAMEGLEVTGDSLRVLLEEFCQTERPMLYLYLPKEEREEAREFLVQRLGRNSLNILDLSLDRESGDFLREHSLVRFGFEHRNYAYVFQTEVLARIEGEDPVYLALKPETIFQERRSHQRYKLWPDYEAFFKDMAVLDISQRGLKVFTEQGLNASEALENAVLSLPQVQDLETGDSLYSGAEIEVPRAMVTYQNKQGKWKYYGLLFDREWPDEDTKKLNDFLLALRKCIFLGGCD